MGQDLRRDEAESGEQRSVLSIGCPKTPLGVRWQLPNFLRCPKLEAGLPRI